MPGRNGYATQGGWANGNNVVNGTSYPTDLVLTNRYNSTPTEYKATNSIEFTDGFNDNGIDEYTAFIVDGTTTSSGTAGGSGVDVGGGYRYGFNGKENDKDISEGDLDFGARIYDGRLGRWLSTDPKTSKYSGWSPYNFGINNPVNVIDPDGEEIILLIWATKANDAGHTAIAIRDYKTETIKVKGHLKTIHKVLDTYTVYELGPASRDFTGDDKHAGTTDRLANYANIYSVTKEQIISNKNKYGKQLSGYDKYQADGIIQIGTGTDKDYKADVKAMNALEAKSDVGRAYNGVTNNCTGYCSDVIPTSEGEKINATENINTIIKKYTIITPNKLYTEVEKLKNVIILKKAPAELIKKGFLEAFLPKPDTPKKSQGCKQ